MLALIALLDGSNAQLFHVEQWNRMPWQYRVKGVDGDWQAPRCVRAESAVFPLQHATQAVEVEWRTDSDSPWEAAVPHEWGRAECEFVVSVKKTGQDPKWFRNLRVCGAVRGHPSVWELDFPPWEVAAAGPETLKVRGISVCGGVGQVLRGEGEFQMSVPELAVMNAVPSQVALRPVPAAVPGVLPFTGVVMIKTGRLKESEIALLKETCNSLPPCQIKS